MSDAKKNIFWAPEARDDLRAIDRVLALEILKAIDEYLTENVGEVKKLRPPRDELRLRVGDFRVFFYRLGPLSLQITSVKHRSQAYR